MVILIDTGSIELECPISPHLGVLRLLSFCQPLKQYLKPVLMFIFISLMPRCFHMCVGCLGFLFCDLPICCLCPLLCHVICLLLLFLFKFFFSYLHCRYLILLSSLSFYFVFSLPFVFSEIPAYL